MSILALLAATTDPTPVGTPVTATGPTWTDDPNGGGTWTTPDEEGITYSPASGAAAPEQTVTVTATAQAGYVLQGTSSWSHTFPVQPVGEWPNYTPPLDTTPYAFPTSSPYNVPTYAITPCYNGTNDAIHPSVTDFQTMHGMTNWNGYRYWMAMTPYTNASVTFENPSILASHDGYTWEVPNGLTNPISPPASNSDTELEYDPDTGRLWCFWRNYLTNYIEIKAAWSLDGVTWAELSAPILTAPRNQNEVITECLSPCVLRLGQGQWVLYGVRNQANPTAWEKFIGRWTAPDPEGPWTFDPTSNQLIDYGGGNKVTPWHIGVVRVGGLFYMLVDDNGGTAQWEAVSYAISADGVSWYGRQQPFAIEARPDPAWDWRPYRATLTPHENGTHMRVWYSNLNGVMGVGYTQIPLSEWDGILPT